MADRYPGYDVMAKRKTLSWNEPTRQVIGTRMAISSEPRFFDACEWQTLLAVCDRVIPQSNGRPVPIAALVDGKLADDARDGYRDSHLPPLRKAWHRGLAGLNAAADMRHGAPFHALSATVQDELLAAMQQGELHGAEWKGMPASTFFVERLLRDILAAYYSHPLAWNEIGFGGPASPRGYVRMYFNRRDPWEAVEAEAGREAEVRKANEHVR